MRAIGRVAGLIARVPIRARLAVAFALVTAAALTGIGLLVFERTRDSLTGQVDRELAAALRDPGFQRFPPRDRRGPGGAVVQVVDPSGAVIGGSDLGEPLVGARQVERVIARGRPVTLEREVGGVPARLLVVPLRDGTGAAVAAASVAERDAALSGLRRELLIGGLIALVLAAAGGWVLAALALRPVERMRRRAAGIGAQRPGDRLPVPPAQDEIRRLGDTLNAMLARLEQGMARERAFVADAAHELRTPLAVLRGEIELATARERSPDELRAALASAGEEADRLAQLAEDLLVIARADQGRLPLRPEPLDAAALVERVARRFALRGERAGREVVAEVPGALRLQADPLRLEQALGNLVENALRHGAGRVVVGARAADGEPPAVELWVRDHGPGVPEEFIGRAFERFTRSDAARTGGGAGLGLAIVAAIAEAHDGTAGIRNLPGGGAEAWVRIPDGAGAAP